MFSQTINQRSGRSKNVTATSRMSVYNFFLNLSKRTKSETVRSPPTTSAEQKPSMPPNTHHKGQGNQKDIIAPKDHPKDTLAPSYGQTPPKCGARHGFFFVNGSTFLHTKSRKIDFRSVQACNNREKYENILGLKQVKKNIKIEVSPSQINMATINLNSFAIF